MAYPALPSTCPHLQLHLAPTQTMGWYKLMRQTLCSITTALIASPRDPAGNW